MVVSPDAGAAEAAVGSGGRERRKEKKDSPATARDKMAMAMMQGTQQRLDAQQAVNVRLEQRCEVASADAASHLRDLVELEEEGRQRKQMGGAGAGGGGAKGWKAGEVWRLVITSIMIVIISIVTMLS